MQIKRYRNYWYLILLCALPLLSAAFLYLETITHQEFLLHLAAIPLEILFGAIMVERFLSAREINRRKRHWTFIRSCLFRSQLREIIVANFAGLDQPALTLEMIRDSTVKELRAMRPQLQKIQYRSIEAMESVVNEYVSAYQTFYNLMEWAINNEFEAIFHDMIFVIHFIHDVESFRSRSPGKLFVAGVQNDPEMFAKVKIMLSDGIVKFVEYAIELKQYQPDVFQTLITDIVERSTDHSNTPAK